MFLHGGWGHLGGNMLFLWIFGDNVEHRVGHLRFLAFYLVCGIAAGLAHIIFNSGSIVPTVGASGAISGVLGGYLVMFPRNRVYVMTYGGVATVPAIMMLGLWIVLQFINGFGSVAETPETGGVAYLAHIGGFVAGMALAPLLAGRRPVPDRPAALILRAPANRSGRFQRRDPPHHPTKPSVPVIRSSHDTCRQQSGRMPPVCLLRPCSSSEIP